MKKNKRKIKNFQSGQIIVVVAFTFIVILAFAGLAIDGGRLYNDSRVTQGTADTVAFTGGLVIGQNIIGPPTNLSSSLRTLAYSAAIERANQNGYGDTDRIKGVSTDPDSDIFIDITGPFYDDGAYFLVTVEIESEIPPTFIQLVYGGPLVNTGRAVVKARPRQNLAYGYTLFASDPSGCKGVEIGGNADVLIEGGGIFSNSDACAANCNSLVVGGSIIVDVPDGEIEAVGCHELNGGPTVSPAPLDNAVPQSKPPITPPYCYGEIDIEGKPNPTMEDFGNTYNIINGNVTLKPGRYDSIKIVGGNVFMHPGIYCIGSGDLVLNSGTLEGDDVTLYFYDGASIKLTGGTVKLSAPDINLYDSNDPQKNNWIGMLIFMEGDGLVSLGGSGTMLYSGTILALDPPAQVNLPKCDANGGGDSIGFNVQLICWSVRYTGGSNSYLKYYEPDLYYYPATIDLTE